MNRLVASEYREVIGRALDVIPEPIRDRLQHVHFLTGTDPFYAGLEWGSTDTGDGRSYRDTPHCCYPWHTTDRTVTIVLPVMVDPSDVVHELGHALDQVLGFTHVAEPVTEYARTNRMEAFAESFRAAFYWYGDPDAYGYDHATRRLFSELAGKSL